MKVNYVEMLKFIRNMLFPSPERCLYNMNLLSRYCLGEYRLTWPHMDWWSDKEFNGYLEKFEEKDGFNTHRRWMLCQLIRLVEDVPGDTAECGVYKGASSWLICDAISRQNKYSRIHHMFDSYEGLSAPESVDGEYWSKGDLSCSEAFVLERLSDFSHMIESHKGWIPEKFEEVNDRQFCFVHVDVDLYAPTRDSIRFFYDRISPGGIFVCDDYGFSTCPGATRAVDEFLSDKPEKMIALDAGGGFFIKGIRTSD